MLSASHRPRTHFGGKCVPGALGVHSAFSVQGFSIRGAASALRKPQICAPRAQIPRTQIGGRCGPSGPDKSTSLSTERLSSERRRNISIASPSRLIPLPAHPKWVRGRGCFCAGKPSGSCVTWPVPGIEVRLKVLPQHRPEHHRPPDGMPAPEPSQPPRVAAVKMAAPGQINTLSPKSRAPKMGASVAPWSPTSPHHSQGNASLRASPQHKLTSPTRSRVPSAHPNWVRGWDCFCTGKPGRRSRIVRPVPSTEIRRPDSSKFLCQKPATTPCPPPDWPSSFLLPIGHSPVITSCAALVMCPSRAAAKMAALGQIHPPIAPTSRTHLGGKCGPGAPGVHSAFSVQSFSI
jgi:hypothetical protein